MSQDTSVMPAFRLSAVNTEYSIEVQVFTRSGGETTMSKSTSSAVTSVTTTFSVAGTELPSPSYMRGAVALDPTFTSAMPLVIPASSMGSALVVHGTALDGNGLESNVIDMTIDLK
jgi:hypothetical protein